MNHLQKFPKTEGDSIVLGTVVALGIKPDDGKFFCTFDRNGELVTYLVDNPQLAQQFNFAFLHTALKFEQTKYVFGDLTKRHDMKYERLANNNIKLSFLTESGDRDILIKD